MYMYDIYIYIYIYIYVCAHAYMCICIYLQFTVIAALLLDRVALLRHVELGHATRGRRVRRRVPYLDEFVWQVLIVIQ